MFCSRTNFNPLVLRVVLKAHSATCNSQAYSSSVHWKLAGRNPIKHLTPTCSPIFGTLEYGGSRMLNCSQTFHTELPRRQKLKEKDNSGRSSTQITESRDKPYSELTLGQKGSYTFSVVASCKFSFKIIYNSESAYYQSGNLWYTNPRPIVLLQSLVCVGNFFCAANIIGCSEEILFLLLLII